MWFFVAVMLILVLCCYAFGQTWQTYAIKTVAGDGAQDGSEDHGPATSAGLDDPRGVAVEVVGNLYVAGVGAQRVRKVSNGNRQQSGGQRIHPHGDIEEGNLMSSMYHPGGISRKLGRSVSWNPEKGNIQGRSEASGVCSRPYRKPWTLMEEV